MAEYVIADGFLTFSKFFKKNIIYVYTPFQEYFLKYPIFLDYRKIDSN